MGRIDRIAEPWGTRTPYGPGEDWPQRVDLRLDDGLSPADVDEWVQSATILHSNGDGLDIAVKDGRIVGVRGRADDRTSRGRLGPKGLHGWEANRSAERLTRPLVRRDGRLVWADALHLEGDYGPVLDSPAGFAGAAACATFVYAGPDGPGPLKTARGLLEAEGVRTGATMVNGVLVARWLADEPRRLRAAFGAFWAGFRAEVGGLPALLPRLWDV